MLGPEHLRTRRHKEQLLLLKLKPEEKRRALELSEDLLATCRALVGSSQEELEQALKAVDRLPQEEKLFAGLCKLCLDDCDFGAELELDPVELRRRLFLAASQTREQLEDGAGFERGRVLAQLAAELELEPAELERSLYADLKGAQTLMLAPKLKPETLLERYELAQLQGVLLRAIRLEAKVKLSSKAALRSLLRKLKFRQLLLTVEELGAGEAKLSIDGPYSVLDAVTRYGQKLALVLPTLLACPGLELRAELRWGKERKSLWFEPKELPVLRDEAPELLPAELEDLLVHPRFAKAGIQVSAAEELFHLPGLGVIVPDLVFRREGVEPIWLELLGYFSRSAVFSRVEWVSSQRTHKIIFALSSRLRVSEEAMPKGENALLHVFKGKPKGAQLLEQLELLWAN